MPSLHVRWKPGDRRLIRSEPEPPYLLPSWMRYNPDRAALLSDACLFGNSVQPATPTKGVSAPERVSRRMTAELPASGDGLAPHPLRARVLAEVHARPFAPVETPRRLLHFGFLADGEAAAADRQSLEAFCGSRGLPAPPAGAKHHRVSLSGVSLRWESHSEFITYTWEFADNRGAEPFYPPPDALAGSMLMLPQPGPLLIAVDLHLIAGGAVADEPERLFGAVQTAAAAAEGGAAVIATDFQPDAHGFVRILISDRGLTPAQAGGLVQRLLEIEAYRVLALLGLPEAQALAPAVRRIETELPLLLEEMQGSEGFDANRRLLERLTALASELEAGAAGSLFRFGATRAYDELIRLRLEAISERPIPGVASWSGFLSRRFAPAIRTCVSTEERQANLSGKLARAAQLLRTRVDVDLESQNRDLLTAMNERARVQLRLQQTVEGLSVAAITYYVASLAHLTFEGLHAAGWRVNPTVATALTIPPVLVAVWLVVRRIRRKHFDLRRK
jgi:uncharacterized membrane-anchored protein